MIKLAIEGNPINYPPFSIPPLSPIGLNFTSKEITDHKQTILKEMEKIDIKKIAGKTLAITAGSRKITHIDLIIKTVAARLIQMGASPFIVPAMGSHGGASAQGQKELLAGYGITEDTMGVPVRSSMESVKIGVLPSGAPVRCDKTAFESDGIVVIGRIKPHTDFRSTHESGLLKMMAVGLGNQEGAALIHSKGYKNIAEQIKESGRVFLDNAPIAFGLGIVENGYDKTMVLEVVLPDNFFEREEKLLIDAKNAMAKLPMEKIDLLIVDEIGKDISGAGMDPNITGRTGTGMDHCFSAPEITRIVALSLSKASHGNATGIGIADFTTIKTAKSIDWNTTYTNCLTSTATLSAKLPMLMRNDKEAIETALHSCPGIDLLHPRIVRIKNTLEIGEILVSEQVLKDLYSLKNKVTFTVMGSARSLCFDKKWNLIS